MKEIEIDVVKRIRVKFPRDIHSLLWNYFTGKEQEHFVAVLLNAIHEPTKVVLVSIGTVNRTLVHPREVFREAIKDNCCAVIVAHNHPAGSSEPSKEDDSVTKMLVDAGKVVGIEVLDHMIIASRSYYSYAENKFDRI